MTLRCSIQCWLISSLLIAVRAGVYYLVSHLALLCVLHSRPLCVLRSRIWRWSERQSVSVNQICQAVFVGARISTRPSNLVQGLEPLTRGLLKLPAQDTMDLTTHCRPHDLTMHAGGGGHLGVVACLGT